MDLIAAIIASPFFYIVLSVLLLTSLKRTLFYPKVLINTIWFSTDKNLAPAVINNLKELAALRRASAYRSSYQLIFWHDDDLDPALKASLKDQGIQTRLYSLGFTKDREGQDLKYWVQSLISLGKEKKEALFFTMASDLLRMQLLFKNLPAKHPKAITVYLDCNDLKLLQLPNPRSFLKLKTLALSTTALPHKEALEKPCTIFDNDLMIANNCNNRTLFAEIHQGYLNNLEDRDQSSGGLLKTLSELPDYQASLDFDTRFWLLQNTTHITNILTRSSEGRAILINPRPPYNKKELDNIEVASRYFNYSNNKELSWSQTIYLPESARNSWQLLWLALIRERALNFYPGIEID